MSSFKSSENIQKKEDGLDRSVSDNQSSSVTLNELVMEARKSYYNFKVRKLLYEMNSVIRKPVFKNQVVRPQKIVRSLKFRI